MPIISPWNGFKRVDAIAEIFIFEMSLYTRL